MLHVIPESKRIIVVPLRRRESLYAWCRTCLHRVGQRNSRLRPGHTSTLLFTVGPAGNRVTAGSWMILSSGRNSEARDSWLQVWDVKRKESGTRYPSASYTASLQLCRLHSSASANSRRWQAPEESREIRGCVFHMRYGPSLLTVLEGKLWKPVLNKRYI